MFDGTYTKWIDGDALRDWVDRADQRPAGTEPEELRRRIEARAVKAHLDSLPTKPDIMTMDF